MVNAQKCQPGQEQDFATCEGKCAAYMWVSEWGAGVARQSRLMSDWWQLCDWCNGGWECVCCSAVNDGSCSPWVMCSCSVVRGNQIRDRAPPQRAASRRFTHTAQSRRAVERRWNRGRERRARSMWSQWDRSPPGRGGRGSRDVKWHWVNCCGVTRLWQVSGDVRWLWQVSRDVRWLWQVGGDVRWLWQIGGDVEWLWQVRRPPGRCRRERRPPGRCRRDRRPPGRSRRDRCPPGQSRRDRRPPGQSRWDRRPPGRSRRDRRPPGRSRRDRRPPGRSRRDRRPPGRSRRDPWQWLGPRGNWDTRGRESTYSLKDRGREFRWPW